MEGAQPSAHPTRRRPGWGSPFALLLALGLAGSPLDYGYFGLTQWAPLGIAGGVLVVALLLGRRSAADRRARWALGGLAGLAVLSFASLLWAESRDAAWSSANLVGLDAVLLAAGLLTIRERPTAWAVLALLGLGPLITALVLDVQFAAGAGAGAFLRGRLNAPMGYSNATAGLLVMGVWPWLGLAERLRGPWGRSAAVGAAALIAATSALTQTRAILLAAACSLAVALWAERGRLRRGGRAAVVAGAAAAALPWTLGVYRSTAPTHLTSPTPAALRGAGLALLGAALLALLAARAGESVGPRAGGAWRPGPRARRGGLVLVAVALVAGGAVAHRGIARQWHDFVSLNNERGAGDRFLAVGGGPRYDLWRIALAEFGGDPVLGVGAGNYPDQEYRRRRGREHVADPHSLELQTLAELGMGGAAALGVFVLGVLAAAAPGGRPDPSPGESGLRPAAAGVFTAWLAATSVDWLHDFPGLTGPALLAAAILLLPRPPARPAAAAARGGPIGPPRRRERAVMAVAVAAVGLWAASLSRQYAATLYRDAAVHLIGSHPVRALQRLSTAASLDPWSLETDYAVAAAYARLDEYAAARAALEHAAALEPENYVPPALLGDIATRAGDRASALAAYERALRLDPLEPALRRAVARARRAQSVRTSSSTVRVPGKRW